MFPANTPEDVQYYLADAFEKSKQWHLPNGGNWEASYPGAINKAAVIGGGTMGRGIAIALALAGYETTLVENDEKALAACRRELEITYKREQALKRFRDKDVKRLQSSAFRQTTKLEELKDCDLVIEAVFENMALKRELFGRLDNICKSDCIFGTNTSSLDIDRMASSLRDPSRLVGIHFFNPAHVIRVVEIVYGKATSGKAVATAFNACTAMKKVAVLVGNCPGFVFNRLLFAYLEQAHRLCYSHGIFPQEIDKAVMGAGFLMGPLTMHDMNGIDVSAKVKGENGWPVNPIEAELLAKKRYGRKTAAGFYKYDAAAKKHPDAEIEWTIRRMSSGARRNTTIRGEQDILEYLLFPLINEGYHCLSENMIADPSLIDLLFIFGFGWPMSSGGPMRWAEKVGLPRIHASISAWHVIDPEERCYLISKKLADSAKAKI